MSKTNLFWFVAAGSGGHIIPGLSIAKQLQKEQPKSSFLFFGTKGRLEESLVAKKFPLKLIFASPWKGQSFLKKIKSLFILSIGTLQVILSGILKRPQLLFSVGGYAAVPVTLAAKILQIPIYILEPNIHAGSANLLASRWARKAFSVPGSNAAQEFQCPVMISGNPIREGFQKNPVRQDFQSILVLGGSQGAAFLSENILPVFKKLFHTKKVQLTIQAGEKHVAKIKKLILKEELNSQVSSISFIDKMSDALSNCDLVIARAGAMSIAELSASAAVCIFVPFPHAADNHQVKNVHYLKKLHACEYLEESENDFQGLLAQKIEALCLQENSLELRKTLSENFYATAKPQASGFIVQEILKEG